MVLIKLSSNTKKQMGSVDSKPVINHRHRDDKEPLIDRRLKIPKCNDTDVKEWSDQLKRSFNRFNRPRILLSKARLLPFMDEILIHLDRDDAYEASILDSISLLEKQHCTWLGLTQCYSSEDNGSRYKKVEGKFNLAVGFDSQSIKIPKLSMRHRFNIEMVADIVSFQLNDSGPSVEIKMRVTYIEMSD